MKLLLFQKKAIASFAPTLKKWDWNVFIQWYYISENLGLSILSEKVPCAKLEIQNRKEVQMVAIFTWTCEWVGLVMIHHEFIVDTLKTLACVSTGPRKYLLSYA